MIDGDIICKDEVGDLTFKFSNEDRAILRVVMAAFFHNADNGFIDIPQEDLERVITFINRIELETAKANGALQ